MKTLLSTLLKGRITPWVCLATLLAAFVFAASAQARVFVATNSTWRYFKGTSEASSPTNAWRELAFDDSAWLTGSAPFHYGTNIVGGDDKLTDGTILSDMRSNYICLFLRQSFVLPDTNNIRGLWLNAWLDDGLALWINGQAARTPISVSGLAYTNTATSSREGSTRTAMSLSNAVSLLRPGTNLLCLQAFNRSLTDDDFRIEAELAETPSSLAFASASVTVQETIGEVMVRVVRTVNLDAGVTVDYATTNGTALAGQDYVATNGSLTFAQGQTEQTMVVPILNDALPESTENFQIKLSNPGGGAILGTPTSVTVSITDSDKGLHFYVPAVSVNEDAGEIKIKVARGDDGDTQASVDYATTDGTAKAGQDYTATAGTLVFDAGEVLKSFIVPILSDTLAEPVKTFQVSLSNPTGGAVLGTPARATVTVTDANPPELRGVLDGSYLNLDWGARDAKLQEAPTPNGPWQTVTTALWSHRTVRANSQRFYRLILPGPGKKWLTVAAVTMTAQTDTEANLQTFFSYMERAASERVDLVVFPEIALQQCPGWGEPSYYPTAQEMAYVQQTAEMIPGQSTSNVVAKAAELNLFVVFGMTEKDGAGLLYNTSVLLGPDGVLGKHRKRYLADSSRGGNEHRIWLPGQVWDVVESPLGKVGLMICVEMAFYPGPVLANQGADLLVTSSGWPAFGGSGGGWDTYTTGNASQAKRWHVVSNQVGAAGHFSDHGHSRVVDPKGTIVCDTGAVEGLVMWATDILIDARTP